MLTLAPAIVTTLVGVVLPLAVDLVTKSAAKRWQKETVLAVLAAVTSVLVTATIGDGSAIVTVETVVQGVLAYVTGFVSFRTVTPVRSVADQIQDATSSFGVGRG